MECYNDTTLVEIEIMISHFYAQPCMISLWSAACTRIMTLPHRNGGQLMATAELLF